MTDDLTADQKREYNGSQALEVIETDSGRKPIWGIVAAVALVAAGVFVVWWSIAKSTENAVRPSVTPSTTTANVISDAPTGGATTSQRHGSSTAATIFFFAMLGAMTLVGVRIYLGARRIYRASHPPSPPPATP